MSLILLLKTPGHVLILVVIVVAVIPVFVVVVIIIIVLIVIDVIDGLMKSTCLYIKYSHYCVALP